MALLSKFMERIKNRINKIEDSSENDIDLNSIFFCEFIDPKNINLHLDEAHNLSLGNKLAFLHDALKTLAFLLGNNSKFVEVETIHAISWIISTHPKIIEHLGFTVSDDVDEANQFRDMYKKRIKNIDPDKRGIEPGYAHVSRDKFLELYGDQ